MNDELCLNNFSRSLQRKKHLWMKKYVHVISVFVDFAAQVFQIPQVTPKVKNVLKRFSSPTRHSIKSNLWGTEGSEIAFIMMTSHWRVFLVNRQVINFVANHALNGDNLLHNVFISATKGSFALGDHDKVDFHSH